MAALYRQTPPFSPVLLVRWFRQLMSQQDVKGDEFAFVLQHLLEVSKFCVEERKIHWIGNPVRVWRASTSCFLLSLIRQTH